MIGADGSALAEHGDQDRAFPLASVTKPLTALAVLVAVEEGSVDLDQPAGPTGSTLRHLLAHASGLGIDGGVLSPPGRRRIYSNAGIEAAAATVEVATEIPFATYLSEAVLEPLGMAATTLDGSPAHGATSTACDLGRFAAELLTPHLIDPATHRTATSVAFPGLKGLVPGFGRQDPNDWGLGVEIRPRSTPTGLRRAMRREPSGTSAGPAASSGSIRSPSWHWSPPRTNPSRRGPSRPGPAWARPCSTGGSDWSGSPFSEGAHRGP